MQGYGLRLGAVPAAQEAILNKNQPIIARVTEFVSLGLCGCIVRSVCYLSTTKQTNEDRNLEESGAAFHK